MTTARSTALLAFVLCSAAAPRPFARQSQEDETDAHGYDKMRIEQEDKLFVPPERVQEVWDYLVKTLVDDKAHLAEIDPKLTSKWSEELFHDTYFDTPTLQLYAMQSGVRHRRRESISNPEDIKSGRELMQIKLNDISANELERAEIKFDIQREPLNKTAEDRHPLLGRVVPEHRKPFKDRLTGIGLDPQSMRPILTVRDVRHRVYILRDGKPFMSISHDQVTSGVWWGKASFCELEPELNEIGFTEADAEMRRYMETVLKRVVGDIEAKFPDVQRNLTPKYNKCFDRIEASVPFLRTLVYWGLQDDATTLVVFGVVIVLGAGAIVPRVLRNRRAEKKYAAQREARRAEGSPAT